MRSGWLEEAVKASKLPPAVIFPRELADEVEISLPVYLVKLPGLTTAQVRDWLEQRSIRVGAPDKNRRIHGCMVAEHEHGFIFWDSQDSAEVQRFTLAHEVAHFVLDYLLPRMKALTALGETIGPVLDGKREPNIVEGLSAMLKRIPLAQIKLMDRGPSGTICVGKVNASEHRADRLAFELLAPAARVLPMLRIMPRKEGVAELASRFGLRREEAESYARLLLGPEHRPFSIRKYFSEEE
jgi:Zn-dependent peptidase ImmA (M78 family)